MVITFREQKGLRKLLNRKPLPTLTVLEPIYPDTSRKAKAEINAMMQLCYESMSDYFDEHSLAYRGEDLSWEGDLQVDCCEMEPTID